MKPRIKSMIWNIRKKKTTHQNKKKKVFKKARIVLAASGTTSRGPTFIPQGARRKRKIAGNWKCI